MALNLIRDVRAASAQLKSRRASAVHQLFPATVRDQITVTTPASPSQYLETDTTEEGRRRNRGVAIKLLPPPQTAEILAQQVSKVKRQVPAWARWVMPGRRPCDRNRNSRQFRYGQRDDSSALDSRRGIAGRSGHLHGGVNGV